MTDQEFMQLGPEEAGVRASWRSADWRRACLSRRSVGTRRQPRTIRDCDPTAHAEIVVLREAARKLENYRLAETTLYVTLEPCAMCAGAIVQARVPRLVYAATIRRAAPSAPVFEILTSPKLNHQVEVTPGVSAKEATSLLQSFFAARR